MGRHRAAITHWMLTSALALALSVGAAAAGGGGVAAADDGTTHDSPGDASGVQSSLGTDAAVGDSIHTVGQDPQPDGSPGLQPDGLRAAPRVPRMVLSASGGARTTVSQPGDTRATTSSSLSDNATATVAGSAPNATATVAGSAPNATATVAGSAPNALIDSISTLPQRFAAFPGGGPPAAVRGPLSPPRGTTHTSPGERVPAPVPDTDDAPLSPAQSLVAVLSLISRDIEQALNNAIYRFTATTTSQTTPAPGDVVQTPYGQVGRWLLKSDGQIANWGGQLYGAKTLLEPINIIIIDETSTTPEESTAKLTSAMFWAGFPAQPIHSTGFKGTVLGNSYDQLPANGSEAAFSDAPFFLPNNHARVFGPAPVAAEGGGFVWTAAASTEVPGVYNGALTHRYYSFNLARDVLALRLILSGRATLVDIVGMENVYNEGTVSTGDNDGYAVVLRLTDLGAVSNGQVNAVPVALTLWQ